MKKIQGVRSDLQVLLQVWGLNSPPTEDEGIQGFRSDLQVLLQVWGLNFEG